MNFLVGLCADDVGKNVFQNTLLLLNLEKYDTFEDKEIYLANYGNNKLFIAIFNSMIDENSKKRRILQEKFNLDAIIMIAWHQGSERNCLILRGAGSKSNISKTDVFLSNFLAKEIFAVTTEYNQEHYFEATHGPELFYDIPFIVMEIGGNEQDWNNKLLGKSVAQVLSHLTHFSYNNSHLQNYYYIAFGRSHCSKTLIKKCCEVGIAHYFAGKDIYKYIEYHIIDKIISTNRQQDLQCKFLIHKRIDVNIENKLISIANKMGIDITYYK